MRTSEYSEQQIIGFLRQAEAGMQIKEIGRKHGFGDGCFCEWRSKYSGMDARDYTTRIGYCRKLPHCVHDDGHRPPKNSFKYFRLL